MKKIKSGPLLTYKPLTRKYTRSEWKPKSLGTIEDNYQLWSVSLNGDTVVEEWRVNAK